MLHSLDVWHKSNKVTGKVSEVVNCIFGGILYFCFILGYQEKGLQVSE